MYQEQTSDWARRRRRPNVRFAVRIRPKQLREVFQFAENSNNSNNKQQPMINRLKHKNLILSSSSPRPGFAGATRRSFLHRSGPRASSGSTRTSDLASAATLTGWKINKYGEKISVQNTVDVCVLSRVRVMCFHYFLLLFFSKGIGCVWESGLPMEGDRSRCRYKWKGGGSERIINGKWTILGEIIKKLLIVK